MKKNNILIIFICAIQNIIAQTEPIITDRPDQTESAATVPAGYFQGEHGLFIDVYDLQTEYAIPANLLRYGINDNFELRLEIEPHITQISSVNQSGLLPLALGLKSRLLENELLELSLIAHVHFADIATEQFKATHNAITTRLTAAHGIKDFLNIGYNFGVEWDGETPVPLYVYTFTCGFPLGERLGMFTEVFGNFNDENNDHFFDAGLTYLLSNNFQADVSGGFHFAMNNYFGGVGLAYRFQLCSKNIE
ncbi:MAG: transporter [Chitinophagales bacterium]